MQKWVYGKIIWSRAVIHIFTPVMPEAAAAVERLYSAGAVRERSELFVANVRGRVGRVGVGEWPSGGQGALSIGNWAHIRAQRYTRSSCVCVCEREGVCVCLYVCDEISDVSRIWMASPHLSRSQVVSPFPGQGFQHSGPLWREREWASVGILQLDNS